MVFPTLMLAAATLFSTSIACPDHLNNNLRVEKRQSNATAPAKDWAYDASYDWHVINPKYFLCQNGTQQSPIALSATQGLSFNHKPTFDYVGDISGNFYNWGYGPAFTVAHDGDWTKHPSVSFDDETVYLKGWHIHAPADHSVNGVRSKAELHLVHVDAYGAEKAVFAIRLDPGNTENEFLSQLPTYLALTDLTTQVETGLDMDGLLASVLYFHEYWTYSGSLTSPPCTEGIRFFVARQILWTSVNQMQQILGVSSFSAREEQQVWQHRINE